MTLNWTPGVFQRTVHITKPFYVALTHHTRGHESFADRPFVYDKERPHTQPYYDAVDCGLRLSLIEGRRYRLPTTAELEYATRAGTTTLFYWGNDVAPIIEYEWQGVMADPEGAGEGDQVRHAGRKKPNPWGFFDITGNSAQWTSCLYEDYSKGPKEVWDPQGPAPTPDGAHFTKSVGYRYGDQGSAMQGTKFGNYRNCSRIGGFRFAIDVQEALHTSPLPAFSDTILELRYRNFMSGGEYGLTYFTRNGSIRNGTEDSGRIAAEYFRRALTLKPESLRAKQGIAEALVLWKNQTDVRGQMPIGSTLLSSRDYEIVDPLGRCVAKIKKGHEITGLRGLCKGVYLQRPDAGANGTLRRLVVADK